MREPSVQRTPCTGVKSFTTIGSPRRLTGLRSCDSRSAMILRACARARSKHRIGMALMAGSTASIRACATSTNSSGLISRRRSKSVVSQAVRFHSSVICSCLCEQFAASVRDATRDLVDIEYVALQSLSAALENGKHVEGERQTCRSTSCLEHYKI